MTIVLLEGFDLSVKTCISQRQNTSLYSSLPVTHTMVVSSEHCCHEIADRETLGLSSLLPH